MALKDAMMAVAAEKIAPSKRGAVKPPKGSKGKRVPAAFLRGGKTTSAEEVHESPAARSREQAPAFRSKKQGVSGGTPRSKRR